MSVTPIRVVRNLRNRNPGNIERNNIEWAGLVRPFEMTAEQHAEPRFCVFTTALMGFRALAVMLRTYKTAHGCDTIDKIVTRLAPPVENVTDAYIAAVALGTGIDPDAVLDLNDPGVLAALCKAIAIRESGGQWLFDPKDLGAGVDLALYPSIKEVPNAKGDVPVG